MVTLPNLANSATIALDTKRQTPASHPNLVAKIHQFSTIEASWLEGDCIPFNHADLNWFTNALCEHFPSHIPEPNATPTADGEVILEWEQTNQFLTLETKVQSHQAYCFWKDRGTGQRHERYLNLNQANEWKWLVNQLESRLNTPDS